MKIKKTMILTAVVSTFFLLSIILVSRSCASQTTLGSLNLPSTSSLPTNARADLSQTASSALSDGNLSEAVISAVQSGSTNTSSITIGPNPNPINTTVEIDIRMDNAVGFWGWTIPTISWNATVLQLTGVAEGPFLADNTGSDPTFFIGNSNSLWNNTGGYIMGGLSEAITGPDTSTDSSGVLATLTFNVTGYGNSPVTVVGGNLRATSTDTTGVDVECNSATVTVASTTTLEFPPLIILPLFVLATLATVVYLRKLNRLKASCKN